MGLFSRFTTFLKAKFSAAMDRAEDPNETLDYSYQKQLEQLQNLKKAIADVLTNEKRLELELAQLNQQIEKYDAQARTALAQGREDLARMALERKQTAQQQLAGYNQQIAQMRDQQAKMVELERRLSARVESFRRQKEMVKASYNAASAQVRIQESVTGISEEMTDVNLAVQRAQDRVLQMQARAQAMDQLTDAGALPEIGAPGQDDIDRELSKLSTSSQVDSDLARLKAEVQGTLPAPRDGQARDAAQLPPPAASSPPTPPEGSPEQ